MKKYAIFAVVLICLGCDQISDNIASNVSLKLVKPITAAMKEVKNASSDTITRASAPLAQDKEKQDEKKK
jgi:hypothetical protein